MSNSYDVGQQIEEVLRALGDEGRLEGQLSDNDIKALFELAGQASISQGFSDRALRAMAGAQHERERQNPLLGLGALVARARCGLDLDPSALANRLGVSVAMLQALETGDLSLRQVLQGFPASVATALIRELKIRTQDFTSLVMDALSTASSSPRFQPSLAALRDGNRDTGLVLDVAEYVAKVEAVFREGK